VEANRPHRSCSHLVAGVASVVLAACAPAESPARGPPTMQGVAAPSRPPQANGVALVMVRPFSFEAGVDDVTDEQGVVDCITGSIRGALPDQPLVPWDSFRYIAFPNLPAGAEPRDPKYLAPLFRNAEFRARVASLGLRFVGFIGGVTEVKQDGGIYCGVGPGGGACLGLITWKKATRLRAGMVDLETMEQVSALEGRDSGTAWFAVVGILPIGMPYDTERGSCRALGTEIAEFLRQRRAAATEGMEGLQ
jgi:hypothetical protein